MFAAACQSEFVIGAITPRPVPANHLPGRAFSSCKQIGSETMKAIKTWIVLADGDQAKIFEHDGPGKGLHAVKDVNLEQDRLRAQDIMADKPGRAFSSAGPGSRSAVDYRSDPVAVRERRFVEKLADVLEQKRQEGAFDRLVIAAAPTALGDLRPALSEEVKSAILAELPKDLTNVPTAKLAEHLDGIIAV
jgi:protein required for attachment to host cells